MTDSVESVLQKSREEFEKWKKSLPKCIGDAGGCDGSLVGLPHEENCPMFGKEFANLWDAWQASRSALEPILAELSGKQVGPGSRNVPEIPLICFHCGERVPLAFNQCTDCKEAAEQALREAQAERDNLGQALREKMWLGHSHMGKTYLYGDDGEMQCNSPEGMADFKRDSFAALEAHNRKAAEKQIEQALSPSPTPAHGCEHKRTSGGNDYLTCDDCGQSWDYRGKPSPDSATPQLITCVKCGQLTQSASNGECDACSPNVGQVRAATTGKGEQG